MTRRPKRKRLYVSYEMLAGIPACPRGLRPFWEVFGMGVFFVWGKETQLLLMEIFDSEEGYCCRIVPVGLAIGAATIAPMVNSYGVPLCMRCADKLGFIIGHYAHRALVGVQVNPN